MRHGKKINHLGRTSSHRQAMLSNMASSLILNKRIETTVAKAKELRKYVEPLITRSKIDNTHNRRVVFSYLQSKDAIKELFGIISEKIADRPGGYTRIIKLGNRLGDNAEICFIELVDFNETMLAAAEKATKTRRSRRGRSGAAKTDAPAVEEAPAAEVVEETPAVEEAPAAEVVEETTAVEEAPAAEVVEETPAVEEAPAEEKEEAPKSEEEDSTDEETNKDN